MDRSNDTPKLKGGNNGSLEAIDADSLNRVNGGFLGGLLGNLANKAISAGIQGLQQKAAQKRQLGAEQAQAAAQRDESQAAQQQQQQNALMQMMIKTLL